MVFFCSFVCFLCHISTTTTKQKREGTVNGRNQPEWNTPVVQSFGSVLCSNQEAVVFIPPESADLH